MEMTTRKASDEPTRVSARAGQPDKPDELKHVHPQGMHDVILGVDDTGRRIIGSVPDRVATYLPTCKACIAADQARMAAPPVQRNLENTLFLIPEPEYDGMVAREYVYRRYPDAVNVGHQFNADKLAYVKGATVIVITRRGQNGKKGPRYKRTKDEEGTFYDAPVPPEEYLHEIVESDPVVVAECITVTPGTMYSDESADFSELIARLAERAQPFRIAPPNAPDKTYAMRLNG